jgi:hypothetical protein
MRLRALVWSIAFAALALPPALAPRHADPAPITAAPSASPQAAVLLDCHDHAPPPAPCPDEGTAKHAAATCCPLMGGAVAVMPVNLSGAMPHELHARIAFGATPLIGITCTKDPPPPRA